MNCPQNHPAGPPPALPWAQWRPGQRVVVRYTDEDGSTRDALGTLVENALDYVVIDARRGRVTVRADQMIVGRVVPPPRSAPLPRFSSN